MDKKIIKLNIDFGGIKDKQNIFKVFNKELLIWDLEFDRTHSEVSNWDAFRDDISSLDTESKTFINYPDRDKITGIHLILENYKALDNIDPKDKQIFEEILEEMTHKENRYDDLDFSYEIRR